MRRLAATDLTMSRCLDQMNSPSCESIQNSGSRLRRRSSSSAASSIFCFRERGNLSVELVIAHPLGHTPPAWIAVILGGPALFLAGRALFEYVVFARVSRDRPIGLLILAALTLAMLLVPPLIVALAATAVLAGIAVCDAARARGRPSEPPSPPDGPFFANG